jgi:hypothetical protein
MKAGHVVAVNKALVERMNERRAIISVTRVSRLWGSSVVGERESRLLLGVQKR